MRHYAAHFGENVETWGVTGLIHDFDYERWPNPPDHTREGAKILRQRGVDEEIVGAILSHAEWNREEYPLDRPIRKTLFERVLLSVPLCVREEYPLDRPIRKTLFAVDEQRLANRAVER